MEFSFAWRFVLLGVFLYTWQASSSICTAVAWPVNMGPEVENQMRHHSQSKASAYPYPCRLVPGIITLPVNLVIMLRLEPDFNAYASAVLFKGVRNRIVTIQHSVHTWHSQSIKG